MKKTASSKSLLPTLHKNKIANAKLPGGTTAEDIADLVEYALNETEPNIKTKRGLGSSMEVKIGGQKFLVNVVRPFKPRRKSRGNGF